jgi:hypothetical protein
LSKNEDIEGLRAHEMHLKNFSTKVIPIFSAHMTELSEQTVIVKDNATKSLNSESLRSSRTFTGKALSNFEPNFKVIKTTVNNHRAKLAKNSSQVKTMKMPPSINLAELRPSIYSSDDRSDTSKTTVNF